MEELGPFDSPYATAALNHDHAAATADFSSPVERCSRSSPRTSPPNVAGDVVETLASMASDDILATGPRVPPGRRLHRRSARHRRSRTSSLTWPRAACSGVTVATQPLTRNPDLRWVRRPLPEAKDGYYDPLRRAPRFTDFCAAPGTADAARRLTQRADCGSR